MNARTSDLRQLVEHEGPFLTLLLPAPSRHDDAAHRFEVERKNALKQLSDSWNDARSADLDAVLADLPHNAGESVLVVRRADGATLIEFIDMAVDRASAFEGSLPRLAPLIEARQRTIPHVVVQTDVTGADIAAFDGGSLIATDAVVGDTEHIHRGHFSGWSQRRYQQRAENTWEENAGDVVDAVTRLARTTGSRLVAVVGPTRARSMVTDGLSESHDFDVVSIEAGDPDGAAAEIVRMTSDVAARDTKALIDRAKDAMSNTRPNASEVLEALEQGRVEVLLVHDDEDAEVGGPDDERFVDRCIVQALLTHAQIHVVPRVAILDQGVAAIMRW